MITQDIITSDSKAMADLLASRDGDFSVPKTGDIVTGHILDKSRNTLYLDLGALGLGVVYGRELFDDMDTYKNAKIGDPVQATIQVLENEEGMVELSLRAATRQQSWDELHRKLESGEIFMTEILDANKGGLIVRVNGVMGFLPVSQLAPEHYPRVEGGDKNRIFDRLKEYVTDKFKVKVITANQEDEKLIVSEKAAVGDELSQALKNLKPGKVVQGTVSGIADFGIFLKFEEEGNELEGLVHISELAWQRIDNPANIVSVGQTIEAKIIGVDGLRISLSIKQLREDPWKQAAERYKVGDSITGEVLKVTAFGGFVKLDEDIHGLVHISELPAEAQTKPETALKAGEKMAFRIISLEPKEHRLGLSLKPSSVSADSEDTKDSDKPKKAKATHSSKKAKKEKKESKDTED